MKGCLIALISYFAAALSLPAASLLPGSIDFNDTRLWGVEVGFGLDDEGGADRAATHWYIDDVSERKGGRILQLSGTATGRLAFDVLSGLHRTVSVTAERGPAEGEPFANAPVYVDTEMRFESYADTEYAFTNAEDRIICWVSQPEPDGPCRFMITAGRKLDNGDIVRHDYPTTLTNFEVYKNHRLTVKLFADSDGVAGFNVYIDGALVRSAEDSGIFFPSLNPNNLDLHSFGVYGEGSVSYINFSRRDPVTDPDYDKANVSAFRQGTVLTVEGYDANRVPLTNFPMLVRISEDRIANFRYSYVSQNGYGLRFTDDLGRVLPFEVDTWNPEGESLVWVKVPYFTQGAKINMLWDQSANSAAPGNNASDVWEDYVAVWHFGQENFARDSSPNHFTATLLQTGAGVAKLEVGTAAPGDTVQLAGFGLLRNGNLICDDYDSKLILGGNFTFTGWYSFWDSSFAKSRLVAGKKTGTGQISASNSIGWSLSDNSYTEMRFFGNGSTGYSAPAVEDMRSHWAHIGMVYSGNNRMDTYANGVLGTGAGNGGPAVISPTTTNFTLGVAGVMMDEIRISKIARSEDWLYAEYIQEINRDFVSNNGANSRANYNFWVEEPNVSVTSWMPGEYQESWFYAGVPRYGVVFEEYYDAATGAQLAGRPTAECGSYMAVFRAEDGRSEPLVKEFYFVIYQEEGFSDLPADRVMLFNSDSAAGAEVVLQGYYDVDGDGKRVWAHDSDPWSYRSDFKYVQNGEQHVYYMPGTGGTNGVALWRFEHARIGNLFAGPDSIYDGMNLLPWSSPTAKRVLDSEKACDSQEFAGTLILQNVSTESVGEDETPAAAYSPHYTNGVGVVYFDAVNAFGGYRNVLKVQKRRLPHEDWQDVLADVYPVIDGHYEHDCDQLGVTNIVLDIDKSEGTDNWFYRVAADIGEYGDVEFRIVRADSVERGWADELDGEGLVLVDNIIASVPRLGIELQQYGAASDESLTVFRGQRAPFDVAFPTTNDIGRLHGAVRVKYLYGGGIGPDPSFIGALSMVYRWRYLNQVVDDWKEELMESDPSDSTKFLTMSPLAASGVGDIEYYFKAVVNAPFYEYCDYSGLYLPPPGGIREHQRAASLRASDEGKYEFIPSPAMGTNFFIRLRDGASDYERFTVEVRRKDTGEVTPVELDVFSDHTWRGFYDTPKAIEEGLEYRVIAYNRQTEVLSDYQYNTNYYSSTSVDVRNSAGVPFSGLLAPCDAAAEWTTLPCDAKTDSLMFQLEDTALSITVIHSSFQTFDRWTDAYSPADNPYFTGSSVGQPTSGVSVAARELSEVFNRFSPTEESNPLWVESFDAPPVSPYDLERQFTGPVKTPNGWRAMLGKWVSPYYGELYDSQALQLRSGGLGSVYPNNPTSRGVGTFSFSARVAQAYDIHSFNYYIGTNYVYGMGNYAFGALVAMDADDEGFDGSGTVSVLANFRDSVGGYEARVERSGFETVSLSLYKWKAGGTGGRATLLGKSDYAYKYRDCGFAGTATKFAGVYISCKNSTGNSVIINAGICTASIPARDSSVRLFTGRSFHVVSYTDSASDSFRSGTCAVGCNNCPATFVWPKILENKAFDRLGTIAVAEYPGFYRKESVSVSQEGERDLMPRPISRVYDYDQSVYNEWNVYSDRLGVKDIQGDSPSMVYGFRSRMSPQYIQVETSPRGTEEWTVVDSVAVDSFTLAPHTSIVRESTDVDIRLHTPDDSTCDIIVDNLSFTQWRGENYDDPGNPDRSLYDRTGPNRVDLGAPTNMVYTTAWIGQNGYVELNPVRSTVDSPAGVRGPLFDGVDGRGLGLGQFSFRYYNADSRAKLLLQVARDVGAQELSAVTESMGAEWETIHEFTFDELSPQELKSGICSWYVGEHGVPGVMRVILDPELIARATSTAPQDNPHRDVDYGRIYIYSVSAKDNPKVDEMSWVGWNLRTARNGNYEGVNGDGDGLMQLLRDGYTGGISFALNNSVISDIRIGDEVKAHMPYLQTPIFAGAGIGEVTFKARRYSTDSGTPTLVVYGTKTDSPAPTDSDYEEIGRIKVDCDRFETFRMMAPVNSVYTGFRFAITGVGGVTGEVGPVIDDGPQRILIDDVAVYEAIKARYVFRNTGCFRTRLVDNLAKRPFPVKSEQPICQEQWGFQTELLAAQLASEIDDTPGREPHVYVHWYEGTAPWGYDNWVNRSEAKHAELKLADDSKTIYRSSIEFTPDAVAQPSVESSVVQYMLEVVFYMAGQEGVLTNRLSVEDWVKPSWYEPVDLNADNRGKGFAAYNLIDSVSPGWAWFNEVNLFGEYDSDEYNTDRDNQWLEIAAPATADLTDWQVRFLLPNSGDHSVLTNTIATFGYGGLETNKLANIGAASGMVFRVICSPATWTARKLSIDRGEVDAKWNFSDYDGVVFGNDGSVSEESPFAMQLVRASGVVEHEVVVLGTNYLASSSRYSSRYSPTNTVRELNEFMPGAHFFYVGKDDNLGAQYSLDVWTNRGETASVWTNEMVHTPGRINAFANGETQHLEPSPPTPLGTSIYIWSTVLGEHIYQTCGEARESRELETLIVDRNSMVGTNIYYRVDEWWDIESVAVNGRPVPVVTNGLYSYSVLVGTNSMDNLTVTAKACLSREVDNPGLVPEGERRYLPAIADWLGSHCNAGGVEWPESTDGKIHQAYWWGYHDWLAGDTSRLEPLTLTQMYWLDMCPTITNDQYLVGGFVDFTPEKIRSDVGSPIVYTNRQMTVYLMITNGLGLVESSGVTNTVYSPYIIRGLDPGSTSWDYAEHQGNWPQGWSNATFKIKGILLNGLTQRLDPSNWVPLRLFVFNRDSFNRPGAADPAYTAKIEIVDPYNPESQGYQAGWGEWLEKNGKGKDEIKVWNNWSIDERMRPAAVEVLRPDSLYE